MVLPVEATAFAEQSNATYQHQLVTPVFVVAVLALSEMVSR